MPSAAIAENVFEAIRPSDRHRQANLQFFYGLVERDLGVATAFQIADALGIHERDVLPLADEQPKNEIRVEITSLKEAHAGTRKRLRRVAVLSRRA